MKDRDAFYYARLNAKFDRIHETKGMVTAEDLDQVGKKAEQMEIEKVGEASEKRFIGYSKCVDFIESVQCASSDDDVYNGVDMWLRFTKNQSLPDLPVQVKSSFKDVRLFRQNHNYVMRKGMEILVNCGPSVTFGNFNKQLRSEIRRIRSSLKDDPSLANFIKR